MQKNCQKIEFFALSPHMAHFDYFLTKNQFQGGGKKIFHQKYTILPFYRSKKSQKMPKLQGFKVFPNFEKSTIFQFYGMRPCMNDSDYFFPENHLQGDGKKIFHKKCTILPFYRPQKSQKMPKLQGFKVFLNF